MPHAGRMDRELYAQCSGPCNRDHSTALFAACRKLLPAIPRCVFICTDCSAQTNLQVVGPVVHAAGGLQVVGRELQGAGPRCRRRRRLGICPKLSRSTVSAWNFHDLARSLGSAAAAATASDSEQHQHVHFLTTGLGMRHATGVCSCSGSCPGAGDCTARREFAMFEGCALCWHTLEGRICLPVQLLDELGAGDALRAVHLLPALPRV